jgi:hypothetical protein
MAGAYRRLERERRREVPVAAPAEGERDIAGLLALQHGVGNASVARMLARVRARMTGETYTDTSAELFAPALDDFGEFTGAAFEKEEARTRKALAKQRGVKKEKRIPPGDVRIEMLVPRLQQAEQRRARASAAGHNVLGVFLGPEWYFKKAPEPYTVEERDAIIDRLSAISSTYPKLLIVPGTIVFRDDARGELGHVAPVFYAGALVTMPSKFDNAGDTTGYGPKGEADEGHMAVTHGGRAAVGSVSQANLEYGAYRDAHKGESRFFQIDNVRFSLEICADVGRAVDEIANNAPFGPGQGAHVQIVVAHGAGLLGGQQTTPAGGHSYLTDAQTTAGPDAEYGPTEVWEGGTYPQYGGRGRTVRHRTHSNMPRGAAADPDLMHGGVHPLPAGTALPVAPPLPVPAPVTPVPVAPVALGLPDDITESE